MGKNIKNKKKTEGPFGIVELRKSETAKLSAKGKARKGN